MNRTLSVTMVVSLGLLAFNVWAGGHPTPESNSASHVGVQIQVFADANGGRCPTNFAPIAKHLGQGNLDSVRAGLEVIPARFVFVQPPRTEISLGNKYLMVVQRKKATEDGRVGRYVVFQYPDGEIRSNWLREDEFQEEMAKSGLLLGRSDPEEAREAEMAVETVLAEERKMKRAFTRMLWEERWEQIKNWFIAPVGTNANTTQTASMFERIRPIPVAVVGVLASGVGVLVFRFFAKRKKSK